MGRLCRLLPLLLAASPCIAGEAEGDLARTPQVEARLEGKAPAADADAPALPFATTRALRAMTIAREVARLRATNPVAADEVAREMAKHDYDVIFQGFLDGTPLKPDDAGDVLAAFVALQWMVANDARAEPGAAALRAIRSRFVAPMAQRPPLSQAASRAAFAEEIKLRAVLHHAGWQAAKRLGTLPRFLASLSNEFIPAARLQALALTDEGLVAKGRAGSREAASGQAGSGQADPPRPGDVSRPPRERAAPPSVADARPEPPAPDASAPPRHAANWDAVDGVYFRSVTGFGVGGMITVDFEPLIVLRDGTYVEIGDAALEDVDLVAERAARPHRFGRWTRAGGGFVLTDSKGRANDYKLGDGSFFRAFPAAAGESVSRAYRRLSGGGNSAMGGDVAVAVESRYDFRADGGYGRGGSVGAINSGASSGVGTAIGRRRAPEGGRYALDRHTLTLIGADGRSRRLFFAYGSRNDPPEIDRDMIFLGDSVFTDADR